MRTLIVYGTKHGTAEKCSEILKSKLQGEVVLVNIKKQTISDITSFDKVIIGGSIYAGQIQKEIKEFCVSNINILKNKKLGFFICGMSDKDFETLVKNYYPDELLSKATTVKHFGGELILKKMNFFEKLIMKMVAKTNEDTSTLSEENIDEFAQSINKE